MPHTDLKLMGPAGLSEHRPAKGADTERLFHRSQHKINEVTFPPLFSPHRGTLLSSILSLLERKLRDDRLLSLLRGGDKLYILLQQHSLGRWADSMMDATWDSCGPGCLCPCSAFPSPTLTFLGRLYFLPALLQALAPARPHILTSC